MKPPVKKATNVSKPPSKPTTKTPVRGSGKALSASEKLMQMLDRGRELEDNLAELLTDLYDFAYMMKEKE